MGLTDKGKTGRGPRSRLRGASGQYLVPEGVSWHPFRSRFISLGGAAMRSLSTRNLFIGASFVAILAALGIGQAVLEKSVAAQAQGGAMAPRFEVDPLWPKPLPNHWVLGQTIGVFVDTDDHIWIVHRSSSTLDEQEKGLELQTA